MSVESESKKTENSMKLRGLSLFSSAGIGETYISDFVDMKVANELLPQRSKLYKHFYPDVEAIQGDITNEEIYQKILAAGEKNKINFIYSTPPCQSFSKAGKQEAGDLRDVLFWNIIRLAKKLKPLYILIENVPEFIKLDIMFQGKQTKVLGVITEHLGSEWYINYDILNTAEYGTHQTRKRSIILLSRKDQKEWLIPTHITNIEDMTVKKAIGHLPSLESEEKSSIHLWHKAKKHNDRHILWMKHTPTGKTAFDNPVHYPKKDGRKIKGYRTTYKRMYWDKPATTITMANGSISSQNNVHPGRKLTGEIYSDARVLTVYELMLLTGLPEDWLEGVPKWASENLIRQVIGECVPPKLIQNLLKNIIYKCKKVIQYDIETLKFVAEYPSIQEASRIVKIPESRIQYVCENYDITQENIWWWEYEK